MVARHSRGVFAQGNRTCHIQLSTQLSIIDATRRKLAASPVPVVFDQCEQSAPPHVPGRRLSRQTACACGSCSSGLRSRKSARLASQGRTTTNDSAEFGARCVGGGRRPRAVGAVMAPTRRSYCSTGVGPCGTHFQPEGSVPAAATYGAGPHAFDVRAGPCTKIGTSTDRITSRDARWRAHAAGDPRALQRR